MSTVSRINGALSDVENFLLRRQMEAAEEVLGSVTSEEAGSIEEASSKKAFMNFARSAARLVKRETGVSVKVNPQEMYFEGDTGGFVIRAKAAMEPYVSFTFDGDHAYVAKGFDPATVKPRNRWETMDFSGDFGSIPLLNAFGWVKKDKDIKSMWS